MAPLAGVGPLDVLVGREVGAGQVCVESGQPDDAPDGEEANDDDHDAGRGLADGIDERGVVVAVALGGLEIRVLAQEDEVGHSAGEDEHAQGGQGD